MTARHRGLHAILMLTVAGLLGLATDAVAQTGTISGTVAGSGVPLPNTEVHFYDLAGSGDGASAIATTNALGAYTVNLPPGAYGILTQNTLGFINEIYDNVPCSAVCDLNSLLPIIVTNGSNFVANFDLAPGGRIAGRITDSGTGLGIPGVRVVFVPPSGEVGFTWATTDANGDYISDAGTDTGTVYAATINTAGYQNEIWNDVKCMSCDWTAVGTPMAVTIGVTTGGFDFALDPGAVITGTVRDANLMPISGIEVWVYDSAGEAVEFGVTDALGNYTTGGLLPGTYYVGTNQDRGFVDEVYDNIPCVNGNCDPRVGQPVAVTLLGTTPGIDFVLTFGGNITGTVTNAVTGLPINDYVFVQFADAAGNLVGGANSRNDTGIFTAQGVAPGTYYASVFYSGFFSQMYNGLNCSTNCNVLASTPIHVTAGATTANINFALVPTTSVGTIQGTVRDITGGFPGTAMNNVNVQLFMITGAQIANVNTTAAGLYTFSNLAPGSYYVRTNVGNTPVINQLYNGVICVNCTVTTSGGTPVPVTAGGTTSGIDFNLVTGGRISGTVTNVVGGAAIQSVGVSVFSSTGVAMGSYSTNASGQYTTRALPAGTYYLRTSNSLGFVDKLYDNLFCPGAGCTVLNGTPVVVSGTATTANQNFQLAQGGRIGGAVTGPAGLNIQFQTSVSIYTDTGAFLGNTPLIDAAGNYLSFALPAGRYYIRTTNSLGLLDELYDNLPCVGLCLPTAGTPIDVTAGATTGGKNFTLVRGGNIAGTVRNAVNSFPIANVRVSAYKPDGTLAKSGATNANGEYVIVGLEVGTYYVRTSVMGGLFYLDELYNELPCALGCTLTDGTPVVVAAGVTEGGKNFTLTPGGGSLSGTVRDAATNGLLGGIGIQVHLANGTLVKTGNTNAAGVYQIALPAGTYYVRTAVSAAGAYLDELFYEVPCTPTCNVAAGFAVQVLDGFDQPNLDFTLSPNLVRNGRFEGGTSNWVLFATPDLSNIVSQVTNGVFEYYRVTGGATQAVVFQETGVALAANTPLVARFSIGNSSSVRKRISVLVLDSNFSELAVCTFFIPPNTPLTPYRMNTHTTQAWANAAIYFYAASAGSNGGFYQLDNVSIEHDPSQSSTQTTCVDPLTPVPPGGADGADLLVNGNFDTGTLAPWGVFGQISSQITGGVFQFTKLAGTPAGVILQPTNNALPAGTILTATFQLGNSSPQRQRVTVIVHDNLFGDLSACTFYVAAGQPLSDYTYRTFTTQAWANATLSVYPATTNGQQWVLLDNVTLRTTPSAAIVGTECVEPGGTLAPTGVSSGVASATGFSASSGMRATQDGVRKEPQVLQRDAPIDLTAATSASFAFRAWLPRSAAWGEVQVRGEDGEWRTVEIIRGSDDWAQLVIDLTEYLGQVVDVRVVVYRD